MFHEKFRWQPHNVRAIQADRVLAEKRRRGWFSDYPKAGSNMYLLASDQVYKLRVQKEPGGIWRGDMACA